MSSPIATPTYAIGSLTFNVTDVNGVTWVVAATQGWFDGPPMRLNQTPLPYYDGAFRAPSYRSPRAITLQGWCRAPSKQAAQSARDSFLGLFATGVQLQLTVADDSQTRTATVELADVPKATPAGTGSEFDWQLVLSAVDPRKYGAPVSATTGLPAVAQTGLVWGTPPGSGAGLTWGTPPGSGAGLVWGNLASNGLVTVSNAGTADAWPVFTITGPVTAPSITDSAGNLLAWSGPALLSTDTLVITSSPFGPRSVLLDGGDNRASLTTAQWAPIPAGTSKTFQFQGTSSGSPSLTVSVSPAYW